jgi:uncharacterized protein YecT (DUF1311 family)
MKPKTNSARLKEFRTITTLIFLLASTYIHGDEKPASPNQSLPSSYYGTWQVIEVHVDTGATRTLLYQRNDPRLSGRIFTITPEKLLTNTAEEKLCSEPKVAARIPNISKLIETSMADRGSPPETPKLQDYELTLQKGFNEAALTVNCKEGLWAGGLGRDGGPSGAWIVMLSNNRLAVRWYDETILLLNRVPENAKPIASFKCENAATPTEKKICGSIPLAAFDRSVAESYAAASKQLKTVQNVKAMRSLQTQQKQWIAKRDGCGTDGGCLEESMSKRMEQIEDFLREN